MRCPRCGGNNREGQRSCWRCGLDLLRARPAENTATEPPAAPSSAAGMVSHVAIQRPTARPALPARRSFWDMIFPVPVEVAGTVIAVEPVREERRQRNWGRLLTGCLVAFLLLVLPLIFLRYLLVQSLLLAVGVVLLVIIMIKFISPGRVLKGFLLLRFLWPRQHDDRVAVQYLRLRDGFQREHIVRIRGRLQGHIMPGDELSLQGTARQGIFEMRRGMNLRTGSSLSVRAER